MAGEPGCRRQVLAFRVEFKGALVGSVARWPLGGIEKYPLGIKISAWSELILDRSRKLVGLQSPAACATRVGGDSDPNFENYDLFHAQCPDTGCCVHARSWRANRDVDVRC